jgi:hypothetical protein
VPRLPIAPRADGGHGRTRTATGQVLDLPPLPYWATWPFGPSGWTRTTTTRVKSPACSVDTTEGLELIPRSALERMAGFEPAPQGLEGPQAAVTPHSLWFGLRVSNPSLRAGGAACSLHTQAERGTGVVHRPIDFRQLSKTPLLRAGGRQGIRTQTLPGENGVTARQRTIRSYRPYGDSARTRTRTHELWRLGCSRYTTLPMSLHVSNRHEDKTSLRPGADFLRASGQNKKGLLGDRPRRPVSQ